MSRDLVLVGRALSLTRHEQVIEGGVKLEGDVGLGALAEYDRLWRAAFRDRLRLDRLLQALLKRPRLTDWVARRLRRDPALADLLAGVTGETVEVARLLRPGFFARLLLA